MAKHFENFKAIQDECKITIIKNGEVLTMTTKEYKKMIKTQKAKATRTKNKKAKES